MSKFKVGDVVRCLSQKSALSVTVGELRIVTELHDEDGFHTKETGHLGWYYNENFELAWQPTPGEMIEVKYHSSQNYYWSARKFLTMDSNRFVCENDSIEYSYTSFIKARPIKKDTTITLANGTKVELSEESYKQLGEGVK